MIVDTSQHPATHRAEQVLRSRAWPVAPDGPVSWSVELKGRMADDVLSEGFYSVRVSATGPTAEAALDRLEDFLVAIAGTGA